MAIVDNISAVPVGVDGGGGDMGGADGTESLEALVDDVGVIAGRDAEDDRCGGLLQSSLYKTINLR